MKHIILTIILICLPFIGQARVHPIHHSHYHPVRPLYHPVHSHHDHAPVSHEPRHNHSRRSYLTHPYYFMMINAAHGSYIINEINCLVKYHRDDANTYLYYYNDFGYIFATATVSKRGIPENTVCDIVVTNMNIYSRCEKSIIRDLNTQYGIKEFNTRID